MLHHVARLTRSVHGSAGDRTQLGSSDGGATLPRVAANLIKRLDSQELVRFLSSSDVTAAAAEAAGELANENGMLEQVSGWGFFSSSN